MYLSGWLVHSLFTLTYISPKKSGIIDTCKVGIEICYIFIGIGGEKCDQCDRGWVQSADINVDHPVRNRTIPYGELPQCVECGECFSNWDRILEDLRTKTEKTVEDAKKVKVRHFLYYFPIFVMFKALCILI